MFEASLEDRPPPDIVGNHVLCAEVASAPGPELGRFKARDGRMLRVLLTARSPLTFFTGDWNDADALRRGYTELARVVAVAEDDGKPHGVWEFYATNGGKPALSKVIEVDHRYQCNGIGKGLLRTVQSIFEVEYSGAYTRAGAALLNSGA